MKTRRYLLSFLLTLTLLLCAAVPAAAAESTEEPAGLTKDVVILFTSDVHCGVNQNFGYDGLYAAKQVYSETCHTLLVDNGDSIQGEPLGTLTKGEADIRLMNKVGYDVAIPGNHEFDYGMDRFLELTEEADFPYISCNFVKDGEPVFDPYVIKEFEGVKIAFVGVTTPKTLVTSTPKYFQDENGNFIYGFCQDKTGEGVYQAVQKAVDDARAEGASYVIVMGHMGNEAECSPWTYADVISHTTGIDCFIDGHSHDTDHVEMQNMNGDIVPRQACGTKMGGIGIVRISAEDGSVDADLEIWNGDVNASELLGFSNEITDAVSAEMDELGKMLDEVIAHSDNPLVINDPVATTEDGSPIRIVRRTETNLGDLTADAFRIQTGADIGMIHGGGIRAGMEGDITKGAVLTTFPFGNELCVIEVTGKQLLEALEWGARSVPEECAAFLHVSGMTYEIHTYIPSGCVTSKDGLYEGFSGETRVKNVMVNGTPLDPDATYTLAGLDYTLLNNGDGFTMFEGAPVVLQGVKIDNQIIMDYLTETLGGVIGEEYADPYGAGRIVAFDEPPKASAAPDSSAESVPQESSRPSTQREETAQQTEQTEAYQEETTEEDTEDVTEAEEYFEEGSEADGGEAVPVDEQYVDDDQEAAPEDGEEFDTAEVQEPVENPDEAPDGE